MDMQIINGNDMTDEILTMAFVNVQPFDEIYSLSEAFKSGSLYPSLHKPFLAGGADR